MTVSDHLRDRLAAYLIWGGCYGFTLLFLLAFSADKQLILVITVIDALALFSHEAWELYRKKGFYDRVKAAAEGLDKKYLLSEMLSRPAFFEGRTFFDTLYLCGKSMTEHVNEYKRQTSDFREYIELWVHEAKIPLAGLGLISHNNPGQVSDKLNAQLKRLDDCIDNVLYYARSENAEKDYIIKEVSLNKAFSNIAVRNREAFTLIGGTIKTDGLDVPVMTDGKWLEFILGQLMANSIKYASSERPLEISVYADDTDSGVTLHFRDNGRGISETDLPYIFEKSFTGQNGRTGAGSTGMGLYIVKSLCERLGHGISASSREGEYTEIKIVFAKNDLNKYKVTDL